jgi:glycosyltransferase involved in cell wall biosynthesis
MLSRETERPYVSVGAVFKQEAHALREWIEHYRWLGVDRIYLIDDGSTDDYLEQMEPYMDMIVCLRHTVASERFGRQGKIYDACLRGIPSEWLLIVDPDEFLYSPLGQDLKTWLRSYASYNQILIPWHVFGSDGLIEQPASLVQGFRRRASKGDTLRINPTPYKAVVRMPSVVCFSVHAHSCRGTTFELPFSSDWVLNHYMIQSLRYYLDVKCTRGSANRFELCPSRVAVAEQAKTWDRFRFIDALATLEDNGLAQLRFPMPNSVA